MHTFDIIISIFVFIFVAFGFKRGFIAELFHFVAMCGGFIGAYFTYPFLFSHISFIKISPSALTVISFILCYILIAIMIIIFGWIIRKIIHLTPLGIMDHFIGGFVGFAKALIMIWIFVLSVNLLPKSDLRSSFETSKTVSFIENMPLRLKIPHTSLLDKYNDLKKSVPDAIKQKKKQIFKVKKAIEVFES